MNEAAAVPVVHSFPANLLAAVCRFFPLRPVREQKQSIGHQYLRPRGGLAVCGLIAVTLGQFLCAADAQAQVKHTIIATAGTPAPAGGNYIHFNNIALSEDGQAAFDAILGRGTSFSGVFVGDGTTTTTIAVDGPASGFGFVSNPSFNARGDVIFDADNGFFRSNGTSITPIVQDGDAAPGGGTLIAGGSSHIVNRRGVVAYQATVVGGLSTSGIFRTSDTGTITIARDNTFSPTGGVYTPLLSLVNSSLNQRGQVAFFAQLVGGSAEFAAFRGDGEETTTIFAASQSAPGGGTFVDFGTAVINRRGQVLALGQLKNATASSGLFLGDGTESVAIARLGDPAPNGGIYTQSFAGPMVLNDHGQAAFEGTVTGAMIGRGIFRGDGVTTTIIAQSGAPAPGTTGTFGDFFDMAMDNNGRVAFIATFWGASQLLRVCVRASQMGLRKW